MGATEKLAVWLLGLTLAAVGWQTLRGYGGFPGEEGQPEFDFLRPIGGGQRVGDGEYFFRALSFVMIEGVAGIEKIGETPFRHGLGPATRLIVRSDGAAKAAKLSMRFYNGVEGQNLVMRYDGEPLETLQNLPLGTVERAYQLPLTPGQHEFRLEYERWNHHGAELTATDGRTMAVGFSRLQLRLE